MKVTYWKMNISDCDNSYSFALPSTLSSLCGTWIDKELGKLILWLKIFVKYEKHLSGNRYLSYTSEYPFLFVST